MVEKIKVVVHPRSEKETFHERPLEERLQDQWTDNPLEGKALLLEDGREVFNPTPVAPPLNFVPPSDINELVERLVTRHLANLKGDEEIDTEEDWQDFDVPDDLEPASPYEIEMADEYPAMPPPPPPPVTGPPVEPTPSPGASAAPPSSASAE